MSLFSKLVSAAGLDEINEITDELKKVVSEAADEVAKSVKDIKDDVVATSNEIKDDIKKLDITDD